MWGKLITNNEHLEDEEIVEKIRTSDKNEFFEVLYDRYVDKVFRKALFMVHDSDVAQDLAHDILIKTYLKLGTFEGKSSFSTWLFQVTYTHCIDYLRRQKKVNEESFVESRFDARWLDDSIESIEAKELFEVRLKRIKDILEEIKPEEKILLLMKYQDDMHIKDMAAFCECGESAVKMKLKRARDKIKVIYRSKYLN
jgi:RNA polymerase sigma-70 factor (ECF subfamily)